MNHSGLSGCMVPTFHDAKLTGLAVSEGAANLSILQDDGTEWRVNFLGVQYLKADDFRQGNTISHFEIVSDIDLSRRFLDYLFPAPPISIAQNYKDEHLVFIDRLVEQVTSGRLNLVSLTPSYGCEMIVVCAAVTVAEVSQAPV